MKKIVLLTMGLMLAFTTGVFAAAKVNLIVNGNAVTNVDAKIIDGSTYVPLRAVSEMLGADVGFNNQTKTVTITSKSKASVNTSTEVTSSNGTFTVDSFTFSDVQVDASGFGTTKVSAEMKNNGNDIGGAVFKAVFYDANGKRVGTASGGVQDLLKGKTKTVELITTDDLSGYAKIKFQIDMSY